MALTRLFTAATVMFFAASLPALAQTFTSQKQPFNAVVVADGLEHPWALAFLPDGRMLVTERSGSLRIVTDGDVSAPVGGVPKVVARGQGGLLDVVLHPDYADNGWLYLSFSAPGPKGPHTAVVRARLDGNRLIDVRDIFSGNNAGSGGRHFGSRIAFGGDGKLFITVGERGDREEAQELASHHGTVVRLNDDGSLPADNPFANTTGAIWLNEHGPQGGDEINLVQPGVNYGWPVITYGRSYAGFSIGEGSARDGLAQPLLHWTPSIAPSGMAFYTGDKFPAWRGNLFVGSLKFRHLVRLELDGTRIVSQERLLENTFGRVRDVRQGPDGLIYVLTDKSAGQIIRLEPVSS